MLVQFLSRSCTGALIKHSVLERSPKERACIVLSVVTLNDGLYRIVRFLWTSLLVPHVVARLFGVVPREAVLKVGELTILVVRGVVESYVLASCFSHSADWDAPELTCRVRK